MTRPEPGRNLVAAIDVPLRPFRGSYPRPLLAWRDLGA